MTDNISTKPFVLPRSVYERYVATRWLSTRWWLLGAPLAAALVAGFLLNDLRWLLVALIYLFIITPAILSFAYFKYLLTPEARLTALPKRLVIRPEHSIRIEYLPPSALYEEERASDDSADNDETVAWLPPAEEIRWSEISSTRPWGQYLVVELKSVSWPRFLLVPRRLLRR